MQHLVSFSPKVWDQSHEKFGSMDNVRGVRGKHDVCRQVTVAIVETVKVVVTFVCGVANANVVVTIALILNFK